MQVAFDVKDLRAQFHQLWNNRHQLQYFWDLVLRMVNPSYNLQIDFNAMRGGEDFFSSFSGSSFSRLKGVYHNRGAVNSAVLASYLHSNLTNPHSDWMRMILPEIYFLQDQMLPDDKLYALQSLQLISQECHNSWQSSNFHSVMFGFYKSLVDIGNACLFRGFYKKGNDVEPVFRNVSMFNVLFVEDAFDRPSHVFVIHRWTAYQIVSFFYPFKKEIELRRLLKSNIVDAYLKREQSLFTVIQSVYTPEMDQKKSHSVYFLWNESHVTSEEGIGKDEFLKTEVLDYMPYTITRIRRSPESKHGTGFSMEAFPLLAKLQRVQKAIWIANDKNVKPPMNMPTDRTKHNYTTDPGALNPMDLVQGKPVGLVPSMPEINILNMEQTKASLLMDIDQTYMIDKIIMEKVKYNRTGTEVQKRTGEEIRLLSPFIGALENDFLRPLVDFTINILKTRPNTSAVVSALRYLGKRAYRLQYISPIAQVQVQKQLQSYLEFYGHSNVLSQKEKGIDFRMNWLAFWIKIAILQNAPFDTIKTLIQYEQSQRDYQRQMQQMRQDQLTMNVDKVGSGLKNIEEANKIRRVA